MVLDFVVDLRVLVEYSLGMDFPEALCGGYVKCCHSVDMSAIVEISGTSIMTEPSIIVGFLVVVIPVAMVVFLMIMPTIVRVVWWIGVARGLQSIPVVPMVTLCFRVSPLAAMEPVVFPQSCRLFVSWGCLLMRLHVIGVDLNLVNLSRVSAL